MVLSSKRVRSVLGIAASVVLAIGVGACGSSKSSSGGGEGGSSASTESGSSSGAKGSPIKTLVISASDNEIYNYPSVWELAEVYAKDVNAKGGVNGHPLEVIQCNDRAEANQAVKCARQAVEEKVTALVGGLTLYDSAVYPILEAAKIPWVGSDPQEAVGYKAPMSFATGNKGFAYVQAMAEAGKECKEVDGVYFAGAVSEGLIKEFAEPGLASEGVKFNHFGVVQVGQKDLSGIAAEVGKAECLYIQLPDQLSHLMVVALQNGGFKPRVYTVGGTFSEADVQAAPKVTEGATIVDNSPPYTASLWSEMREAVKKYAPGKTLELSIQEVLNTWLAFQVFTNVAENVEGEVTPESVVAQLEKTSSFEPGTSGKLDFSKPLESKGFERLFNPYTVVLKVKNGVETQTSDFIDTAPTFIKGQEALAK